MSKENREGNLSEMYFLLDSESQLLITERGLSYEKCYIKVRIMESVSLSFKRAGKFQPMIKAFGTHWTGPRDGNMKFNKIDRHSRKE